MNSVITYLKTANASPSTVLSLYEPSLDMFDANAMECWSI